MSPVFSKYVKDDGVPNQLDRLLVDLSINTFDLCNGTNLKSNGENSNLEIKAKKTQDINCEDGKLFNEKDLSTESPVESDLQRTALKKQEMINVSDVEDFSNHAIKKNSGIIEVPNQLDRSLVDLSINTLEMCDNTHDKDSQSEVKTEEMWDKDTFDDLFEPSNYYIPQQNSYTYIKGKEEILQECIETCPHDIIKSDYFFLPAQSNMKPSFYEKMSKNSNPDLDTIEDGQFDDA